MGRGNDPQIDRDRAGAANGHHLAFLQDAQQRGLRRQGEIADLVEKEGAPVRRTDEARRVAVRA